MCFNHHPYSFMIGLPSRLCGKEMKLAQPKHRIRHLSSLWWHRASKRDWGTGMEAADRFSRVAVAKNVHGRMVSVWIKATPGIPWQKGVCAVGQRGKRLLGLAYGLMRPRLGDGASSSAWETNQYIATKTQWVNADFQCLHMCVHQGDPLIRKIIE